MVLNLDIAMLNWPNSKPYQHRQQMVKQQDNPSYLAL